MPHCGFVLLKNGCATGEPPKYIHVFFLPRALFLQELMQGWASVRPTSTALLARWGFKEGRSEGSLCRSRQNAAPPQHPCGFRCRTEARPLRSRMGTPKSKTAKKNQHMSIGTKTTNAGGGLQAQSTHRMKQTIQQETELQTMSNTSDFDSADFDLQIVSLTFIICQPLLRLSR